jgi:hypothetical protein
MYDLWDSWCMTFGSAFAFTWLFWLTFYFFVWTCYRLDTSIEYVQPLTVEFQAFAKWTTIYDLCNYSVDHLWYQGHKNLIVSLATDMYCSYRGPMWLESQRAKYKNSECIHSSVHKKTEQAVYRIKLLHCTITHVENTFSIPLLLSNFTGPA